ncbi:MAG: hypothetical protein J4415_02090 [Candidatus Diapherotrites archaeon]|uniref:Uncharacterized protein n=1 Tax=Candidatus Iainarchaeum sp. TaxID=3101447 RepID=A0A8T4KTZ2_9ARCH|nr:hypothetical protein [Candidatus Diapherotrites archaeon]
MRKEAFEKFFNGISKQMTVDLIARKNDGKNYCTSRAVDGKLPVFDALDLFDKTECLVLNDGRVIERSFMLKRPLRVAFFALLTEIESRLYRISEWCNNPIKELNEKNLNDFIRCLLENGNLFSYQTIYKSKKEFREDLKAISAFRNTVMHVTKRFETETDFETVVKRKKQALKLIEALGQILDRQEAVKNGKA